MAIWSGYIGLAVGFILLVAMLLWIVISSKGSVFLKAVLIPVTTWYGAVLFFSAQNLMGWPVEKYLPEESYILAFRIREPEPASGYPGAIFIWASMPTGSAASSKDPEPNLAINPKSFFDYQDKSEPRAYRLPYDRELHKNLVKAGEDQKNHPGSRIQVQKKRPGEQYGSEQSVALIDLNIVNPMELLPDKDQ